jgi:hypothetical protein
MFSTGRAVSNGSTVVVLRSNMCANLFILTCNCLLRSARVPYRLPGVPGVPSPPNLHHIRRWPLRPSSSASPLVRSGETWGGLGTCVEIPLPAWLSARAFRSVGFSDPPDVPDFHKASPESRTSPALEWHERSAIRAVRRETGRPSAGRGWISRPRRRRGRREEDTTPGQLCRTWGTARARKLTYRIPVLTSTTWSPAGSPRDRRTASTRSTGSGTTRCCPGATGCSPGRPRARGRAGRSPRRARCGRTPE